MALWPGKYTKQRMILAYLTAGFSPGVRYTEKGVNEILKGLHTFGDHVMLRRGMYDAGLLDRTTDGAEYWLTEKGRTEKETFKNDAKKND